jgi:hypothetical protein
MGRKGKKCAVENVGVGIGVTAINELSETIAPA